MREYIYCRNSAFRDGEAKPDEATTFTVAAEPSSTNKLQQLESSFVKAPGVYEECKFPGVPEPECESDAESDDESEVSEVGSEDSCVESACMGLTVDFSDFFFA